MATGQSETRRRVQVSHEALGHPHNIGMANSSMEGADEAREKLPVVEGVHYEVLASTIWGDYHTPTIVKWVHGPTDNFTDKRESMENQERALEYVEGNDDA